MLKRWEHDDRRHGVGDATQLVVAANELVAASSETAWVAEEPELQPSAPWRSVVSA